MIIFSYRGKFVFILLLWNVVVEYASPFHPTILMRAILSETLFI